MKSIKEEETDDPGYFSEYSWIRIEKDDDYSNVDPSQLTEMWVKDNQAYSFRMRKELGIKMDIIPKIERNDPCPCGSGKKYKKCCLVL
jgi:preprotein translocase subunit SecA